MTKKKPTSAWWHLTCKTCGVSYSAMKTTALREYCKPCREEIIGKRPCEVCGEPIKKKIHTATKCTLHDNLIIKNCECCKKDYWTNNTSKYSFCSLACQDKVNPLHCGYCNDLIPRRGTKDNARQYCNKHLARKYHGTKEVLIGKNIGSIKECEAKTHPMCSGKMIISPSSNTHCGLCVKPHTGRQVVVKQLFTY